MNLLSTPRISKIPPTINLQTIVYIEQLKTVDFEPGAGNLVVMGDQT